MLSTCICKRSLLSHSITTTSRTLSSHFHLSLTTTSSSDSDDDDPSLSPSPSPSSTARTIAYLVDTWALSRSAAAAVAQKVRIKDPLRPDMVLNFLKDHSFTMNQIASLLAKRPEILATNPRTRLKPKVEFFRQMGLCGSDFAKVVTSNPSILCSKLESKITGSVNYLKQILGSDENIIATLKRDPWLLHNIMEKTLARNIETLRSHNMPEARITQLLRRQPRCLMQRPERFMSLVLDAKDLGYDPSVPMFIYALPVLSGMSSATWNKKVDAYRSFGWSDDEILTAFRRHPDFAMKSVERIREVMNFMMRKLGLKPKDIARYPTLITYSLEKTIIPRCCVLNILISRGILSKDSNLMSKLHLTKIRFAENYVVRYQDEFPEVLEAYEGKMKFEGFGL